MPENHKRSSGSTLAVRATRRAGDFSLDVDFAIARWPALVFGPSGAGKSTLLRLICGLENAPAASILLGGVALAQGACDGKNCVQMVAQRPALFAHLNVEANVAFGLRDLATNARRERVAEMLSLLGATVLARRMPQQLSGGERQRVAIARALAPGPRLLLLDEAFSGLDGDAKHDILERLSLALRQSRTAAIFVTHEVSDAFALDAEVIKMKAGRIVMQGNASAVLADERDRLLQALNRRASPGV